MCIQKKWKHNNLRNIIQRNYGNKIKYNKNYKTNICIRYNTILIDDNGRINTAAHAALSIIIF